VPRLFKRAAATANGKTAHAAWLESIDGEMSARANAAGFVGLHALLAAIDGLPAHDVARLLDVTVKRV